MKEERKGEEGTEGKEWRREIWMIGIIWMIGLIGIGIG